LPLDLVARVFSLHLTCYASFRIKKWTDNNGQWYNSRTITPAYLGKPSETIFVTAATAMPESNYLIAGSHKGCVKVWNRHSTAVVDEQLLHNDIIHALSATKTHVFSASGDKTVKVGMVARALSIA
jgi:WD40 repeat protein